ncbi:MAG: hypothetical protein JGK17_32030 [Microcoleus sp. PH2017_10_PVI_O_A]|nr:MULTISPECIES: hypothetical protein [unclassified Microcoleus]MCC3410082.1 hypothetical protein [Microcoleus sp. PH2017_10_PVI_O_A]MCC3464344.1 hypothetical protein [Microcoleus sp. PH2017_11_PCY_U_A]MCC3482686.1 hypothetical protein [Microcoleus sp. PH2017_12_PCY_D_A]MCC3543814.1 hypothetical protein [Microcoleus sp. PH2017_22_RUC_O_B]
MPPTAEAVGKFWATTSIARCTLIFLRSLREAFSNGSYPVGNPIYCKLL